jgi:hypothetical protein
MYNKLKMVDTIKCCIGNVYYNITTDVVNENESLLYFTDINGNTTDFPNNTNLYFYSNTYKKNIVEKSTQKYIINNDICYELHIDNIMLTIKNHRKCITLHP